MIDITKYAAVMAAEKRQGLSDRYSFIPTTRVINVLERNGWLPSRVVEKNVRKVDNSGFQTHMIRFRRVVDMQRTTNVGEVIPEVVMTNAHDGHGYYEINAGLFRLICRNGAVVADGMFAAFKIKHIGYTDAKVKEAIEAVMDSTPRILSRINDFRQIELNHDEQMAFGLSALVAKYERPGEELEKEMSLERLVAPWREADRLDYNGGNNSLWNTYNVVQEKLVEKGARIRRSEGVFKKARKIASVTENVRVNKALWTLTEAMAKLKNGEVIDVRPR